nr:uncharacterized protein LOC128689367 [Cherax quadricarinatus]
MNSRCKETYPTLSTMPEMEPQTLSMQGECVANRAMGLYTTMNASLGRSPGYDSKIPRKHVSECAVSLMKPPDNCCHRLLATYNTNCQARLPAEVGVSERQAVTEME